VIDQRTDKENRVRTGHKAAKAFSAFLGALIAISMLILVPWPVWIRLLLAAALAIATVWYSARKANSHQQTQAPAETFFSTMIVPSMENKEEHVTGVFLPSMREDYSFLFSAKVLWSERGPVMDQSRVNMAALAVDTILRRARQITEQRDPGNASLVQHELAGALAEMQDDPTGRFRTMATSVGLELPGGDQERLEKLATVRKEEDIWEHARRYEQNKREYLSDDVLKDPGSAVVWWLSRNDDKIEKAVQDIGILARLSYAAKNEEVPEAFHRLAPDLGFTNGSESTFSGFDGADAYGSATPNGKTAADHFEAFLSAIDLDEDDPERLLFARRVAEVATKHGKDGVAEDLTHRFDPPPAEPEVTPEANDGD
jgi:hypothetical protein